MKKSHAIIITIATVVALALTGVVYALLNRAPHDATKSSSTNTSSQQNKSSEPARNAAPKETTPASQQTQTNPAPAAKAGYYGDYTDVRAADRSYDKTILFFHAPWCSECRAFEQAIQAGPIPADVQILKVDYDSRQDLRQKYGVRIQSTFVELDDDDDQDNDHDVWVGYGKDKSINAILRNL